VSLGETTGWNQIPASAKKLSLCPVNGHLLGVIMGLAQPSYSGGRNKGAMAINAPKLTLYNVAWEYRKLGVTTSSSGYLLDATGAGQIAEKTAVAKIGSTINDCDAACVELTSRMLVLNMSCSLRCYQKTQIKRVMHTPLTFPIAQRGTRMPT